MTATADARRTPSGPEQEPWVGVIDDDASIRTAIARALRGSGIPARTFGSAEEYIGRPADGAPACIVLDVQLGGISGFDLQDFLAARGENPAIVFITGHDNMVSRAAARARPGCGCLFKPFDTNALLALVRPHLRPSSHRS